MAEILVEVQNLRKEFDGTVAVADVSFSVPRGEIVGSSAPNGAGKTTTIQILLGLIKPSAEKSRFRQGPGAAPHRDSPTRNFSSAYTGLPSNLKVWENLLIFARIYGVNGHRQKIDELLEMFEIAHLRNKITGHLSSGESTRVNLCKSLLNDPELLMLMNRPPVSTRHRRQSSQAAASHPERTTDHHDLYVPQYARRRGSVRSGAVHA